MPIYDYRCDHCGHVFSAVQSFNDDPLGTCSNCGKRPRRMLSKPAIVFKGSGWYKTDSRAPTPSETTSKDGEKKDAGKGEKKQTASTTETATTGAPSKDGDRSSADEKRQPG
jgi:putative FmdB family regulatory protein